MAMLGMPVSVAASLYGDLAVVNIVGDNSSKALVNVANTGIDTFDLHCPIPVFRLVHLLYKANL